LSQFAKLSDKDLLMVTIFSISPPTWS